MSHVLRDCRSDARGRPFAPAPRGPGGCCRRGRRWPRRLIGNCRAPLPMRHGQVMWVSRRPASDRPNDWRTPSWPKPNPPAGPYWGSMSEKHRTGRAWSRGARRSSPTAPWRTRRPSSTESESAPFLLTGCYAASAAFSDILAS